MNDTSEFRDVVYNYETDVQKKQVSDADNDKMKRILYNRMLKSASATNLHEHLNTKAETCVHKFFGNKSRRTWNF